MNDIHALFNLLSVDGILDTFWIAFGGVFSTSSSSLDKELSASLMSFQPISIKSYLFLSFVKNYNQTADKIIKLSIEINVADSPILSSLSRILRSLLHMFTSNHLNHFQVWRFLLSFSLKTQIFTFFEQVMGLNLLIHSRLFFHPKHIRVNISI